MIGLRRALWAIAVAAVVVFVAQAVLLVGADFFEGAGLWIILDVFIGGGFVAVGLFAWYRRPDNRVGALMTATGFAWFLSVFVRTEPALLFTLGGLFNNLFIATAIHLLLAFPSGRLAGARDRWLVGITYAATTVGFLPAVLFLEPAADGCVGCPPNLFLIEDNYAIVEASGDALSVVGIIALLGVIGSLTGRWRAASPPMRRVVTPVFAAGAALSGLLVVVLAGDLIGVSDDIIDSIFFFTLVPFGLVPYLFLGVLARARMLRGGAVSELIAAMGGGERPQALRDALARALNDPSLELAYWLPESSIHVDADGARLELPGPGSGRATSDVTLDGERVAVLVHDPLLLDEPELIVAVGAAATLALEKERLDAELRAKVGELRESRQRLITVGLAERRRLERDLHDGAQQRLVSLALDIRLARDAVSADPERAEELLEGAGEELDLALAELRELARGLHPAVLSDRGLDPAIDALAGRAPIDVEVAERLGERVSEAVELAAYYVVSEALTNVVKYADADRAVVRVGRDNASLVVRVADDGIGGADPEAGTGLRGLGDRLSVLGGRLEIVSAAGEGTTVIARIPCE